MGYMKFSRHGKAGIGPEHDTAGVVGKFHPLVALPEYAFPCRALGRSP